MKRVRIAAVLLCVYLTVPFSATSAVFDEPLSIRLIDDIESDARAGAGVGAGSWVLKRSLADQDVHSDHGHTGRDEDETRQQPTDEWVVQIDGGRRSAAFLASDMGYEIAGLVKNSSNQMHESNVSNSVCVSVVHNR